MKNNPDGEHKLSSSRLFAPLSLLSLFSSQDMVPWNRPRRIKKLLSSRKAGSPGRHTESLTFLFEIRILPYRYQEEVKFLPLKNSMFPLSHILENQSELKSGQFQKRLRYFHYGKRWLMIQFEPDYPSPSTGDRLRFCKKKLFRPDPNINKLGLKPGLFLDLLCELTNCIDLVSIVCFFKTDHCWNIFKNCPGLLYFMKLLF